MLSPNMLLWHIDYFESKLLKKQPVQELSDTPLSPHPPREQEVIPM